MKGALFEAKEIQGAQLQSNTAGVHDFIQNELDKIHQNSSCSILGAKGLKNVNDIYEVLYKKETRDLDGNLQMMKEYIKPQANQIYYDRKVEYINLTAQAKKAEDHKKDNIRRRISVKQKGFLSEYHEKQNELVNLMRKYDIKHPLRGEEFEGVKTFQQPFHDKIISVVSNQNSYLSYKKDQRLTMDQSELRSDAHIKAEQERDAKAKIIMKYRLYGIDGITNHEFQKLVNWEVIKKVQHYIPQAVKVKKRTRKTRFSNTNGEEESYSDEMSGSQSSCWTEEEVMEEFITNDKGDPTKNNRGFILQPLPAEIYGKVAAHESKIKFRMINKKKTRQRNAQSEQTKTLGNASFINYTADNFTLPEMKNNTQQNFGSRNNSVQVAIGQNVNFQTSHPSSMDINNESQMSLGVNSALTSIVHKHMKLSPIAKNAPKFKKPVLMPHLVHKPYLNIQSNRSSINEALINQQLQPMHNNMLNTIQIDQGSEDSNTHRNSDLTFYQDTQNQNSVQRRNDQNKFQSGTVDLAGNTYQSQPTTLKMKYKESPTPNQNMPFQMKNKQLSDFASIQHGAVTFSKPQSMVQTTPKTGRIIANYNAFLNTQRSNDYMHGDGDSGLIIKKPRHRKMLSQIEQLSSISTLIKTDNRAKPGNPFRFKSNKPVKAMSTDRSKRFNQSFLKKTPHIQDKDIKEMIEKYPLDKHQDTDHKNNEVESQSTQGHQKNKLFGIDPLDPISLALKSKDKCQKNKLFKKAFDSMIHQIDRMERKNSTFYKEMLTKMVTQNIRDEQMLKLADALKEIDYSEPDQILSMFEYHNNDANERTMIALDVAKEYKEGKLDPHKVKMTKVKR